MPLELLADVTCSRGVRFPIIPTEFREEVWYGFVPLGGESVCGKSLSVFSSFDGLLSGTSRWQLETAGSSAAAQTNRKQEVDSAAAIFFSSRNQCYLKSTASDRY